MNKILLITLSLFAASVAMADVHPTCKDYFDAIDSYIEDATKKYGDEASAMTQQFAEAKDIVKQLPKEQQELTCSQGIESMKQARTALDL